MSNDDNYDSECVDTPAQPVGTKCNLDTRDNVWFERGDPGAIGICLLDTLDDSQVIYCVERDDRARDDLFRVTSDPRLLEIARTIPKLPTVELADEEQTDINRPKTAASIPFYAIFQGRPPGW